ncbi:MAG TPA: ABC transporter substrate-binding protein [Clostridiales bacterium]|nr:ABC transporter substrate-binding protein [Clostridiales bacterium]
MKYHIDTIPIWDAYHEKTECPLCLLKTKSECDYIDSFLGGSVMEPDTRIEVNEKGFCPNHFQMLYDAQNRLGLALMSHTYLKETFKKMQEYVKSLEKFSKNKGQDIFSQLSTIIKGKHDKTSSNPIEQFANWLNEKVESCIICERLDYTLNRYAYTIIYLWDRDKNFQKTFKDSKGFCIPHFSLILSMAVESLNEKKQKEFLDDIIPIQVENLERLDEELLWFTQKFDYRNQDKPWGDSKDALPRAIQKLSGAIVENE